MAVKKPKNCCGLCPEATDFTDQTYIDCTCADNPRCEENFALTHIPQHTLDRLDELTRLKAGWLDGITAGDPISAEPLYACKAVAELAAREGAELPTIFPQVDGTLQSEWIIDARVHVKLTFISKNELHTTREDLNNADEDETITFDSIQALENAAAFVIEHSTQRLSS